MIAAHQPQIFAGTVVAGLSSVQDGSMRLSDYDGGDIESNYETFLAKLAISPQDTTYQLVTYEGDDFLRYKVATDADRQHGIEHPLYADGIAVQKPGHALFLPLADCTGAILYDPVNHALMVSHLGRHSTEQHGAAASVAFMHQQFGSRPQDLLVWFSPSPGKQAYPLFKRDNMSLHEANCQDILDAGVLKEHLEVSEIDTAIDGRYFSHSEFIKGNRATDGRFAIVAALAPDAP